MTPHRRARARRIDAPERLDDRALLAIAVPTPPAPIRPISVPRPPVALAVAAPTPPLPILPALVRVSSAAGGTSLDNIGQILNTIHREYLDYQRSGDTRPFASSQANLVRVGSSTVEVEVNVRGDANQAADRLRGLGLQVGPISAANRIVSGTLPIASLPLVAGSADVVSVLPVFKPVLRGPGPARGVR